MNSIETTTKLQLRRETLRELTIDDLRQTAGGRMSGAQGYCTNQQMNVPNCL